MAAMAECRLEEEETLTTHVPTTVHGTILGQVVQVKLTANDGIPQRAPKCRVSLDTRQLFTPRMKISFQGLSNLQPVG